MQDRSRIHHGGLVLGLGGPPPDTMSGHYWTDRGTQDEMQLVRVSRESADDYHAAEKRADPTSGAGATKA